MTFLIKLCSTICFPVILPEPVIIFTDPFGNPASSSASDRARILNGATIDGFITIVLPHAKAAAKPLAINLKGVFHGTICPITPYGSLIM